MNNPRLEWIARNGKPEVFGVSDISVDIGRILRYSDISILHSKVTKKHTRIAKAGEEYEIIDLQSVYGTYLNGKRVERARLRSGDMIRIADAIEFLYREDTKNTSGFTVSLPRSRFDVCWINKGRLIIGDYEGGNSKILRFRWDRGIVECDISDLLQDYPRQKDSSKESPKPTSS